ncbi:DUF1566 domain-containing protein [Vibrio alginolyticus]|uniref:Lcl C-terminal domain-containing protein n=1 Tax=Vibrio alginolyticus TaxID=663 RepID=UPI001BD24880|nr:DUF1566 domain-containing protein [Vibrio alginolyticus]MBS9834898.1 DUF1566 domain-containing protein [Vibrio alginolyticus]
MDYVRMMYNVINLRFLNYSVQTIVLFYSMLVIAPGYAEDIECKTKVDFVRPTTSLSDFVDYKNGVVKQISTGLMWQLCPVGQKWDGATCLGNATQMTFYQALTKAEENTAFGYTNWRLPNVKELYSIVEKSCRGPYLNQIFSPFITGGSYWSSTFTRTIPYTIYGMSFSSGRPNMLGPSTSLYPALLVRSVSND